jgi:hypothetical protein
VEIAIMNNFSQFNHSYMFENFKVKIWRLVVVAALGFIIFSVNYISIAKNRKDLPDELIDTFPHMRSTALPDRYGLYPIYDNKRTIIGYFVKTLPCCSQISGYSGPIPMLIAFTPELQIKTVVLLHNNESKNFIEKIKLKGLLNKWTGMSVEKAIFSNIDAVTGATISSVAIINSVKKRLSLLKGKKYSVKCASNPTCIAKRGFGVLAILVSIMFFMFLKPAKYPIARRVIMVMNLLILGFLNALFLSSSQTFGWIQNGFRGALFSLNFYLFISAIISGIFLNRNFYCNFICPFGCAQELTSLIPIKKSKLPTAFYRAMPVVRLGVLGAIVLTTLIGAHIDLTLVEPFSAFVFWVVPIGMIIFAVLMLILSIFFPRFWCHWLCPTGALLDIFKSKPMSKSIRTDHFEEKFDGHL